MQTQAFSGPQRAEDGLTVFFQNEHGYQQAVVGRGAPVTDILRGAILEMETWPGEWRVACISSPSSIWRDLQGTRDQSDKTRGSRVVCPEENQLGNIGRLDLWDG